MSYIDPARRRAPNASSPLTNSVRYSTRTIASGVVLLVGLAIQAESQTPISTAEAIGGGASLPTISINDNRWAAGRLEQGVLTLHLEARNGMWYPEGPGGPGLPVAAFAEEAAGPLMNPGPLIRVPVGTRVRVTVRNSLTKPLTLLGLGNRRGLDADTVRVEPDSVREFRFVATEPGTYYYAGKTGRAPVLGRSTEDSQLHGAIIVDPVSSPTIDDRVFVIGWWFTLDSTRASGLGRATLVINGRSWPHTERLDVAQGDSLRWRWINLTGLEHPLHLHGFYFAVDGVGDGASYTTYTAAARRMAVTEPVRPGATMTLSWSPNRSGNWIFHCHFVGHISHHVALGPDNEMPDDDGDGDGASHASHTSTPSSSSHEMAGLVLGIRVAPRGEAPKVARAYRPLRLIVRSKPNVYGTLPGYAYVLGGSGAESDPDTLPLPGPTLVLEKGEPVGDHRRQPLAGERRRTLARDRAGKLPRRRPGVERSHRFGAAGHSTGRFSHGALHAAACGDVHVSLTLQRVPADRGWPVWTDHRPRERHAQ